MAGPAKVNLLTRELTINPAYFGTLQSHEKKFVLLHEAGHLANKNKSETAADLWALKNAHKLGLSPKAAMLALTTTLNPNRPEHIQRANTLFNAYQKMKKSNTAHYVGDNYEEAPFIGKAVRKAVSNYKTRRDEKREDKQEFKLAKIDAKAQGRALVAESGGGIGSTISSVLGGLFGGSTDSTGGGYDGSGINPYPADGTAPKDNTMLYVGLGVAAIVLFVVAKKNKWF